MHNTIKYMLHSINIVLVWQYLDTLLELVTRRWGALPQQLAEDDDLFEEEHSSLFGARQHAAVLLRHKEGLLLEQLALAGQFTLKYINTL